MDRHLAIGSTVRPSEPEVCLITLTMGHHAGRSGYHRLCDYIDGTLLDRPERLRWGQRMVCRVGNRLVKRSGLTWYQRREFVMESMAALRWMRYRRQVFHFLYGENSYRYLSALRAFRGSNRLVATFHTPRERFLEVVGYRGHLERLDRCVAVSTVQLEFLGEMVDPDRIRYIPHGIDTAYYRPGPVESRQETEGFRCLFVGRHLRDIETLERAIVRLRDKGGIRFHIVGPPELADRLGAYPNVTCQSGISDAALLALYQKADALVMPLLDCTANNAILEAMACGLPIVTTQLQGVMDYVDATCAQFCDPGDDLGLAEAVVELSENVERCAAMGLASRERAERHFDWERIAGQFLSLYREL